MSGPALDAFLAGSHLDHRRRAVIAVAEALAAIANERPAWRRRWRRLSPIGFVPVARRLVTAIEDEAALGDRPTTSRIVFDPELLDPEKRMG